MRRDEYPERMDEKLAAPYIGVKVGTLQVWRSTGRHKLPFTKAGRRVFYNKRELDRWLGERTGVSTSEIAAHMLGQD